MAYNPALNLNIHHHPSTCQTARATVWVLGGEVPPSRCLSHVPPTYSAHREVVPSLDTGVRECLDSHPPHLLPGKLR